MGIDRRNWLKYSAATLASFSLSHELFAGNFHQQPGKQLPADIIKLSSNENPYGPSPASKEAMRAAVENSNRYPWNTTTELRKKIGEYFGLTDKHIVMGAGSSELLGLVSIMVALKHKKAVAPDPTFRLWMPAAEKAGMPIQLIPLTENKVTDLTRMKEAVNDSTGMVYICNPNNPTGTILPANELTSFIESIPSQTVILLDEAYTEFSDEPSLAKLVDKHPNLIVAKTFSKIYGMAGARIGYAIAHPDMIKALTELQPWGNAGAGAPALAGALACMGDEKFISHCKQKIKEGRTIFNKALDKASIPYINSHTNFVYFDATKYSQNLPALLEKNNIVGARTFEANTKWYRLSIGTVEEMEKVAGVIV